jgi:hypothetical protein
MSLPRKIAEQQAKPKTTPDDPDINAAEIQWALDQFKALDKGYCRARDYYDGKHNLRFATAKFKGAFGALFEELADNLCPVVVETVSDRLKIAGFAMGDPDEDMPIVGFGAPLGNPFAGGAGIQRQPGARPQYQTVYGSKRGTTAGGQKDPANNGNGGPSPAEAGGDPASGGQAGTQAGTQAGLDPLAMLKAMNDAYMSLLGAPGMPNTKEQKLASKIWRKNRMKQRSGEVHLDALIEGDSYIIVWPDINGTNGGIPYIYPNRANAVTVRYDDERPGVVECAAKLWRLRDGRWRLNLYYADRLEKYITKGEVKDNKTPEKAKLFTTYRAPVESVAEGDDTGTPDPEGAPEAASDGFEPWPMAYEFGQVPVFHFGNRASIGGLGTSELSEGIPIQDALNKSVCDLLVAGEFRAVQQRYIIGLEDEKPGENRAARFPVQSGGVWSLSGTPDDVKVGEFSAADLTQFVVVIEMFSKHMARATRTPLHYFTQEGAMPSGESFKTAEAPLLAKIDKRQTAWGAVWEDVMRFAMSVSDDEIEEAEPQAVWENTEPRNESSMVDNTIKKVGQLGMSATQGMRELGYSDSVIIRDRAIKAAERATQAAGMQY